MNANNTPINEQTPNGPPCLLTVKQFCQRHAWATPGGIRHLIFYGSSNGFDKCIRRLGRRVLLDEAQVFEWLDRKNESVPR